MEEVPFCSLKTAQKKQENLKCEMKRSHVRSFLITEVFYRKVESNRIDFPKQIRIKRKYLTSQDEVPILCWIGAEDSAGCEEDEVSVVSYADESDEAGGRIYGVPNIEGEQ